MRPLFAALFFTAATASAALAQPANNAAIAVQQGTQASGMASGSAAHSLAASGQVTLGASSVPLKASQGVAASAGAASGSAANASAQAASARPGAPLPVTDQTVTVIPPDQALKAKP